MTLVSACRRLDPEDAYFGILPLAVLLRKELNDIIPLFVRGSSIMEGKHCFDRSIWAAFMTSKAFLSYMEWINLDAYPPSHS